MHRIALQAHHNLLVRHVACTDHSTITFVVTASPFQPSISHATARPVSPLASSSSHSNLSKVETKETVAKNYVVHETPRSKDGSKPSWKETMAAMFGDTVKWDELKVYTNKGRPLCTSLLRFLSLIPLSEIISSAARTKLSYHRPSSKVSRPANQCTLCNCRRIYHPHEDPKS